MLKTKAHNDLFELGQNVYDLAYNASFIHDDHDSGCYDLVCRNSQHHRLLNLDAKTEVRDTVERIAAMNEVWK